MDPQLHFYAVPSHFNLAQSPSYMQGKVYGQDVSSGAAVAALLSSRYDVQDNDSGIDDHRADHSTPGATTEALRVLDLCCCPGLKLCALADGLAQIYGGPTSSTQSDCTLRRGVHIVGVDVSADRLALCKRVVRKYQIHPDTSGATARVCSNSRDALHIQLYCSDGTTFGKTAVGESDSTTTTATTLVFDSNVTRDQQVHLGTKRKRQNKSARLREQKLLHQVVTASHTPAPGDSYDLVLVDAECSTDGSIKHVQQRLRRRNQTNQDGRGVVVVVDGDPSYEDPNGVLSNPEKIAALVELQRRLLLRGFELLRPGGCLVYSTCSLSEAQNEEVVEWLLRTQTAATLVPIDFRKNSPPTDESWITSGKVPGTLRFLPAEPRLGSRTHDALFGEGFFLAKFRKKCSPNQK